MAEELSYDAVEHRTEALLEEWGECQRRTPSAMPKGWPGKTVESKLMDEYGRKTKGDQRRRWAWQRNKGKTRTQGRLHNVHVLAPDRNDKDSDGGTRPQRQWPKVVQDVDRVIAGMPARLRQALLRYYVEQHSLRSASQMEGCSRDEMDRRVDRGRWYVASRILDADLDSVVDN